MRRNGFYIFITLIVLQFNSAVLLSSVILPNENDSNLLASELCYDLLQNPSDKLTPFYAEKLIELAPAVGRTKISTAFKAAVKYLEEKGENEGSVIQYLRLSADELDRNSSLSEKNFSVIKKWNISGPWKKYGKPDFDFQFNPEKVLKIENIEKARNLPVQANGMLYPYKFHHEEDETYYMTYSFISTTGIILWIESNSAYKLIINGKEVSHNSESGLKVLKAFSLTGARGYTIQVKLQCGSSTSHPYIRGMISDEKNLPVQLKGSSAVFNFNYTSEKIFSIDDIAISFSQEASILTARMKELISSENYSGGYGLGVMILEKYQSYFPAYKEFIPLLDLMNREKEFNECIGKFRKIFPCSDIHSKWLADYYLTRDREKFNTIMKSVSSRELSEETLESYVYLLCGEKKYSDAVKLSFSLKEYPFFNHIIPEIISASGDAALRRKTLLEGAAVEEETDFYYGLGLAEIQSGLDPLMYWGKGISSEAESGFMQEISNLYENGIISANEFYKGTYTDVHPEFKRDAKKRKIVLNVFESGRVFLDGEDIIPSGKKIVKEKYSESGIEFSSGEIKTTVPSLQGVKILYVLSAEEGLPSAVDFNTALSGKNGRTVNFKCSGEEEFSVIKYSGEYTGDKTDPLEIIKNLKLKSDGEDICELDFEVICHGNFKPYVRYNGETLSEVRQSDGVIKFSLNRKFSRDENTKLVSDVSRFSSDKTFAEWYSNVILYSSKTFALKNAEIVKGSDTAGRIKEVHFFVMSSITKHGVLNFNPRKLESVMIRHNGTVEERTHLAKAILENRGIKSFIAFKKNRDGLIEKILLYVPEKRDSGYWLDFYGDGISDKMESGYDALVITGEGYETFKINPETYIR